MNRNSEIQEGIKEYYEKKEERVIKNKEEGVKIAKGLLKHILNKLPIGAVFSRKWINQIYNSTDKKYFNEENIEKIMGEKNVFDFMKYQINQAMEDYN